MTDQLHFRWAVSYLGCVEYEVCGDGPLYCVEVRREASSYERSIFNGDDAEWQRDVVAAVGLLRRSYCSDRPIPQLVVDGFNAWRAAEHAERVDQIRSQPERYGNISLDDPLLVPPAAVRGAHYEIGTGWIVNGNPPESAELAHASRMDEAGPSP